MNKLFNKEKLKSLLPYNLLAMAFIISYMVLSEIALIAGFFSWAWNVLTPFLYGFMLAYIVNIPISGMQRLLIKTSNKFFIVHQKLMSALIMLVVLVVMLTLLLMLVIPAIADSIVFFIDSLPVYYENIMLGAEFINNLDMFDFEINAETALGLLGGLFADISIESIMSPINALMAIPGMLLTGFIAFVSSIYILVEKNKFKGFLRRLLKVYANEAICNGTVDYASKLNKNVRQYINTQTLDGVILGTLVTVQLFLFGSPYALILGLMLGILNYIPYFGSIFGTIIAIAVVMLTQGIGIGAIVAVTLLITQMLDANVIQPRLMSGSFSLSPLLVIISVTVGNEIAGIFGMLISIPIVAILKDIYDSITAYYERKKLEESGLHEQNSEVRSE